MAPAQMSNSLWSRQEVEEAYRRYSYGVYRRCLQLLKDEAEAHDVSHEVFLQILSNPDAYRGAAAKSTYLYAIATHKCLNRVRHRSLRDGAWETAVGTHVPVPESDGAEQSTSAREILARVFSEADERTALIGLYFFVDGLSQTEIAGIVGLSRVTVNQHVQKLRARGKAVLANDDPCE